MPEGPEAEDFLKSNPSHTEFCTAILTSGEAAGKLAELVAFPPA
jgi:hypothetical protein